MFRSIHVLSRHFGLEYHNKIVHTLNAPFVLSFYDYPNKVSNDRGSFKFLNSPNLQLIIRGQTSNYCVSKCTLMQNLPKCVWKLSVAQKLWWGQTLSSSVVEFIVPYLQIIFMFRLNLLYFLLTLGDVEVSYKILLSLLNITMKWGYYFKYLSLFSIGQVINLTKPK